MNNIIVRFDLEGIHSWPDAPAKYHLLRAPHGHIFHFEIHVPVGGANREIEFLEFRRQVMNSISGHYSCDINLHNFEHRSCEMLTAEVAYIIKDTQGVSPSRVVVMEDCFVGASWEPDGK